MQPLIEKAPEAAQGALARGGGALEPREVAAPVRRVVLLEDRAQVSRRVEVDLPAGQSRLRAPGLTPLCADRTLVARLGPGAQVRVDELRVQRRWRIGPGELPPDAAALALESRRIRDEQEEGASALAAGQRRLDLLRIAARLLVDSVNAELPYATRFEPRWEQELEEACRRMREQQESLGRAFREQERRARELEAVGLRARQQSQPTEIFEAELWIDVTLPAAGRAAFDVEYTVPCALWRPIHRATLAGGQLRFECEAAVWQHTGEEWRDVELQFSTARSTQRAEPPLLRDDALSVQRRQEKKVSVQVREQVIATTGEGGAGEAGGGLPGVDDGGETRLLPAAVRTTLASDGRMRRVPVFEFTAPAEVDLLSCPELEPLVHLRARAANTGRQPILAGPVDLLRSSGYVGRSQVGFVAPGEKLALGFGSEDALRVRRDTWSSQERARLTGRLTITHRVELYLSNLGDAPASFVVQERVPVSELEKVKVELDEKQCKPLSKPDEQGIVSWSVSLPAHGTDKLTLVYQLNAASDVEGLG
jgi:hypothetical protein